MVRSILRRAFVRVLMGSLIAAAGAMGASPGAALAHHSRYCGHSNKQGAHWTTRYDHSYEKYVGRQGQYGVYDHHHVTAHYYSPYANGFFNFKHNGNLVCGSYFGSVRYPVATAGIAGAAAVPYGCFLPYNSYSVDAGADIGCIQDVAWVEPDQPTDDNSTDNDDIIPCLACTGATAGTSSTTSATPPVRLDARQPARTVASLRLAGFVVAVHHLRAGRRGNVDVPVMRPGVHDGCVVGIYSRSFGPIDPRRPPKRLAVEVASSRLSRAVGHGC